MIVRFGLHADGLDPSPRTTTLGEIRLGPRGLLETLETELGLPPVLDHPAAQVARYRSCLADANDFARFYHASFEVDPIGVSRELMRWRAGWYEAGWDGRFRTDQTRLADMAAVEALARERAAPCVGQRLAVVAGALKTRKTQIERLVLLDDPGDLPLAWRRVVDAIGFEPHPGVRPAAGATPDSDLARLQAAFSEPNATQPLEGDGSVLVIHAESRDVSARALAEYLRGSGLPSRLLIAERDGIVFDRALERSGLPRCGFQHRSRFRPVTQVPALALALLWRPVDPRLLLQFLLHPVAPLPWRVRRPLAAAVAERPGVGGPDWQAAMTRIEQTEAERPEASRTAADEIRYWLEAPRFAQDSGAPIDAIVERTNRCARWLERRRAVAEPLDERLYTAAISQCKALVDALDRLSADGHARVPKPELDRLIDEAATAQPDASAFAQAGHVPATTHPATVVDPVDEVLWWDLAPPPAEPARPWSSSELTALAAAGVDILSPAERLRRRRRDWLRPLLNCRRRLILVAHRSERGRHPLLGEIEHRCPGFRELHLEETLLRDGGSALPQLGVPTPALPVRPPQPARRWWSLPSHVGLPARPVESYTSLSKLYDYPHEWVLRYLAELHPGRAANIHDRGLLYGNLAHRLLERFFETHPERSDWAALPASALHDWLDSNLERLFASEGAVLLQRGRGGDRQYVADRIERGLAGLLRHLRGAGIEHVQSEVHQEAQHAAFELRGTIDLLLTDAAGRRVVVDVKWGSEPYRQREMEAGRHLQLATYAWLHRSAEGRNDWPYPAYYIVTTGNVVAPDRSVFPNAVATPPETGEAIARLWERAEVTGGWRRAQLDRGLVEVPAEGTEPDERSRTPEDGLEGPDGPDRFDDFRLLTGVAPAQ
ncbi:MAG: PD-(D/E)XK nuclease family protein [Gammaproteobacteria bacterium]|nr:PD-(D/E)XK nuclease family protein [Gammaproteobacteria bacterium]